MVILNDSNPLARLRVLYIGSAVPLDTAEGLEAVQAPLRERYPIDNESSIEGIDALLTISNACIQLQYMNSSDQVIQFPISSLTLCAAVRCIHTTNGATGESVAKFVSLQDPLAGGANAKRPAIFTAMTRRTQGRKVLECHGFICQSSQDAMHLVKCARNAGINYKKSANGSVAAVTPRTKPTSTITRTATLQSEKSYTFGQEFLNESSSRPVSGTLPTSPVYNGAQNGTAMRLIPGEPVAQKVAAGPEFFEPVSTQGYFYSSNNADVKKYNIHREGGTADTQPPSPGINGGVPINDIEAPTVTVNGTTPAQEPANGASTTARPAPSRVNPAPRGPPPPIYVRLPPPGAPRPPGPMFYGPPPPNMYMRPRFFSPPPPRMRPHPFAMPPGGPMPMYAPPIFVRRPRRGSQGSSRSKSSSSRGSRGSRRSSRSKTPTNEIPNGDTAVPPTRIPNADESSDESLPRERPSTPPTDYDDRRKKGERRSRRDAYEVKYAYERRPPSPRRMMVPPPDVIPPYGYVYHPNHGGYPPFPMYNPQGRSRSLPPNDRRHRSKSPNKKKGKKKHGKKHRKHKHQPKQRIVYQPRDPYAPQPYYPSHRSDISTESFGYHSEVPMRRKNGPELSGYTFYPPRDFRRDENQHMNERGFSKSIAREEVRSRDSRSYPTAYELNDALDRASQRGNREDPDFNLY